jgi:phenylacetate-CoA ligase
MIAALRMPTLLHPDDHAFHRMVAAFEGAPGPWQEVNRTLRDAVASYAAQRSPYYRSVIRAGMAFQDVPILTKEVIRERYDDLVAEGVHRDRWVPNRTSGSTGRPVSFVRDAAQGLLENLSARRFLRWMQDIPPEATTVWVAAHPPGGPNPPPRTLRRILGRAREPELHSLRIYTLTPRRLEQEVRTWNRFRRWFLYGHASAITWIAGVVDRRRLALPNPPSCVVTTSDTLTGHAAARVARAFGVPVHSWYGSNEMNGFVAGTLPGSRRYAFNPFLVHPEVIDDAGAPARPGQPGRLILTDLNNLVMPFIRYETGDLAVASDETAGGFPIVGELVGRDSEVLRLPSGKVVSGATVGAALFVTRDFVDDVEGYQCAKVGDNRLELRVVWARRGAEHVRAAAADAIRSIADPDTEVLVRPVDRLARWPSGKVWIVRDESTASATT